MARKKKASTPRIMVAVAFAMLLAACLVVGFLAAITLAWPRPSVVPPSMTPTASPWAMPSLTPTAIATVTPTRPPMPSPTLPRATGTPLPFDPSIYLPKGAKFVCARQGDLDGDNRTEWLLLYMESVQAGIQEEKAMVVAPRESGVKTYSLYRADKRELGEYELCDFTIGDFNKDGKTEIAISGGAGAHYSILSIFQWNGSLYASIGAFGGDAGTGLRDMDGDGVPEIIEAGRFYDRAQLFASLVYSWQQGKYVEYYRSMGFTFGQPDPITYPEEATLAFYLLLDKRSYADAYRLLSQGYKATVPLDKFASGFANTEKIAVEELKVSGEEPSTARVAVKLAAFERQDGKKILQRYGGTWQVVKEGGDWKLNQSDIKRL